MEDGAEAWVARYDGADGGSEVPYALAFAPEGNRVYVVGSVTGFGGDADLRGVTLAYLAEAPRGI